MTLQVPAKSPLPQEIHEPLEMMLLDMIESSSAGKKLDEERDALLAAIKGKVPLKVHNDISNLFMAYACEYAYEMFKFGLMIGHNPAILFELTESTVQA